MNMDAAFNLAKQDLGTWEWAEGHNPKVVKYFKDVGHAWVKDDETAWCAAFVGAMLKRSGLPHTGKLNARSYLNWGEPVALDDAQPGDVVVFSRGDRNGWQGHVAFFVRKEGSKIVVLGGNQKNQVNEKPYAATRLLGIRRIASDAPKPKKQKQNITQSTTMRAAAAVGVSGVTAGTQVVDAVSVLPPVSQYILIGAGVVFALGLLWICKERIRKFANGDR